MAIMSKHKKTPLLGFKARRNNLKKLKKLRAALVEKEKHSEKTENDFRNAVEALKKAQKEGKLDLPGIKVSETDGSETFDGKTSAQKKIKTPLFPEEETVLRLEFMLKKIPVDCGLRAIRINLPQSYRNLQTSTVCLFAKDSSKTWDSDVDKEAREIKEYLTFQKGVDNVNQVISLNQLKREYKEYEAKHRLCSAYDIFLVDDRVAPHVHRKLGKPFFKAKKIPTAVRITKGDVKTRITNALRTTVLISQDHCPISMVKMGDLNQSTDQLVENFQAVLETVEKKIQGSWRNVRSISLIARNAPPLPIYMSTGPAHHVNLKIYKKVVPVPVQGELSTLDGELFGGHDTVKVYPNGTVTIIGKRGKEIDYELSDEEADEAAEGKEEDEKMSNEDTKPDISKKIGKNGKKRKNSDHSLTFLQKKPKKEEENDE